MSLFRSLSKLICNFSSLNISQLSHKNVFFNRLPSLSQNASLLLSKKIHVTNTQLDLMEFFDDPENWSKKEVKVGRAWKKQELRLKSNSDLHKLWYVLLKERNMLMTMMHEFRRVNIGFPNPERLDKVEISMENIEKVVRERDRAYFELETGESGERPIGEDTNCFGLPYRYKMREYSVPKMFNKKFLADNKLHNYTDDHGYVKNFLIRLNEKKMRIANREKRRRFEIVCQLLKRFPDVDEEALKHQFPDIDIERAKRDKRSRGHRVNLY